MRSVPPDERKPNVGHLPRHFGDRMEEVDGSFPLFESAQVDHGESVFPPIWSRECGVRLNPQRFDEDSSRIDAQSSAIRWR